MKKIFLFSIFIIPFYALVGITSQDMGAKKRFATLEDFEAEVGKYNLLELDEECIAGKEESCFVLRKLMERELEYFRRVVENLRRIEEQEKIPVKFGLIMECIDEIYPEKAVAMKNRIIQEHFNALQEAKQKELNRLKKVSCTSTADTDGLKQYMECRKTVLRNKYKRLQEKYPNELIKVEDPWLYENMHGQRYYYSRTEANWLSNLQYTKKSCTRYGDTDSCIKLQKMRKK